MKHGWGLLIISVFVASVDAADVAKSQKPNVIFILADDSGFADFGCYGHPYARTPNIDQFAREGDWLHAVLCDRRDLLSVPHRVDDQ